MDQPRSYELSTLAQEDLLQIFNVGLETWGVAKAYDYARLIEETLNRLAEFPDIGKPRDEVYRGSNSFPVGSHIIFYRKMTNGIQIARILHQRMDYVTKIPHPH